MPFRLSPTGARPFAAVALAAASLVAAAAAGSIFLQTARDAGAAIVADGPASPADGILGAVALLGTVLSVWVGLGLALSALSALPGATGRACSQLAARIAPAAVRKVVAFVLGTALTAALVPGTAVARTGIETPRPAVVASAQHAGSARYGPQALQALDARRALGPLGTLGNMADAAPDASFRLVSDNAHARGTVNSRDGADAAPGPSWQPEIRAAAQSASGVADVVVLRGDSLWSIAARHLGPAATTAEIDAEWHRWFAANRQVIGADPDVISPGQVLLSPGSGAADS